MRDNEYYCPYCKNVVEYDEKLLWKDAVICKHCHEPIQLGYVAGYTAGKLEEQHYAQIEIKRLRKALSRFVDYEYMMQARGHGVAHQESLGDACICRECIVKLGKETLNRRLYL